SALLHKIIEAENPEPGDVRALWDKNFNAMSEDFVRKDILNSQLLINTVLLQIKQILEQHNKCLDEYNLLSLDLLSKQTKEQFLRIILKELNIQVYSCSYIALAIVSSRIAMLIMPGGQTAHSRFNIPLSLQPDLICTIDLMECNILFSGKIVVFGGNFHQPNIKVFKLYIKVNNDQDNEYFKNYLLNIGNRTEPIVDNNMICILDNM
ncbi:9375_t:CDS:2, partial [Dentiscutata heterogama]